LIAVQLEHDPRFLRGVDLFKAREFFEASEEFEDLFFEAVRDEVPFVRVFLQGSIGALHAERGQRRAAIERLHEGILAIAAVTNDRGYDLAALQKEVEAMISALRAGESFTWPVVEKQKAEGRKQK